MACGRTNGGTNLGLALPMTADVDIKVQSFKYPGKTLGEIFVINPGYLHWIVCESKCSDRVKKSAARIICGVPYTPPNDDDIYYEERCYRPGSGWDCIKKVIASQVEAKIAG